MNPPAAGQADVGLEELMALVAGTLGDAEFSRVALALQGDASLRYQLAQLEQLRDGLVRQAAAQTSPQAGAEMAKRLEKTLQQEPTQAQTPQPTRQTGVFQRLLQRITTGKPGLAGLAGLAYGALTLQLLLLVVWIGVIKPLPESSGAGMRGAGPDSKQLGSLPEMVYINVSFDPATTEASLRGLLLEIQAELVSGPNQLGQYRLRVARNRSELALARLRETVFVEQAGEVSP